MKERGFSSAPRESNALRRMPHTEHSSSRTVSPSAHSAHPSDFPAPCDDIALDVLAVVANSARILRFTQQY